MLVFALVLVRLAWRGVNPIVPALPDGLRPWERPAATLTHRGFYVLLLLMPVTGWLMASASPLGIPTVVFGLFALPNPVGPNAALERVMALVHGGLAVLLVVLLLLHVGAALRHHFVLRDDVLTRMLPGGKHEHDAEALAYWATATRHGRAAACRAGAAGPRRGPGPRALVRHQPRHRGAGRPGAGAAEPARGHAGAVPGGRVPVPGQVRLLQRRRGRGRRGGAARPGGVLPPPAPDGLCRAGAGGDAVAGGPAAGTRAVLAANMETALNAVWDGAPRAGERIHVIGAGVVGCLVAYLCGRLPGAEVTLADILPERAALAAALGVAFAPPEALARDADLVFHASGHPDGLRTALAVAGLEARIVELSWYGSGRGGAAAGRGVPQPAADPAELAGRRRWRRRCGRAGAMPAGWPRRWSCCATPCSTG